LTDEDDNLFEKNITVLGKKSSKNKIVEKDNMPKKYKDLKI
jgi:hypothetical protein